MPGNFGAAAAPVLHDAGAVDLDWALPPRSAARAPDVDRHFEDPLLCGTAQTSAGPGAAGASASARGEVSLADDRECSANAALPDALIQRLVQEIKNDLRAELDSLRQTVEDAARNATPATSSQPPSPPPTSVAGRLVKDIKKDLRSEIDPLRQSVGQVSRKATSAGAPPVATVPPSHPCSAGCAGGLDDPEARSPEPKASVWLLREGEADAYVETFWSLAGDGDSVGGPEARELFEQSGLPVPDLSRIWQLADLDGDGRLDLAELICAMAIVARRREGSRLPKDLPEDLLEQALSLANEQPKRHHPAPSPPDLRWHLEEDELARYEATFYGQVDVDGVGVAGISEVKALLERSGLPPRDLALIYSLADLDGDGFLSLPEFLCAMTLVDRRLKGAPLPQELPVELLRCLPPPPPPPGPPDTPSTVFLTPAPSHAQQAGGIAEAPSFESLLPPPAVEADVGGAASGAAAAAAGIGKSRRDHDWTLSSEFLSWTWRFLISAAAALAAMTLPLGCSSPPSASRSPWPAPAPCCSGAIACNAGAASASFSSQYSARCCFWRLPLDCGLALRFQN
eukprot:TRINITY_DN4839_c0_g1_i3.p1 TRINITY_DN4839_c0_g1~~TRINITY_DN4839_c0_g1_i3.p1  ORF type:complete len:570 (+),score=131.66 TRINITY_DN4839_c0_g1_i3:665-2374(+)